MSVFGIPGSSRPVGGAVALAAIILTVSGCEKKAGGQVVAVVNQEELTQQDMRAPATAENITSKAAFDVAAPALVNRLVDRSLLADYARNSNLDRGPEYVARRRQMEESLLAYLGLRKIIGKLPDPTPVEAGAYVAANPLMFSGRQRLILDQLRFATPADPQVVKDLKALTSLEEMIKRLELRNVKYTRAPASFDSGTVDTAVATQITRLPQEEIFELSTGGQTYLSRILSREQIVTDRSKWEADALNALRGERLKKAVDAGMKKLKAEAKIQYDPAYAPRS